MKNFVLALIAGLVLIGAAAAGGNNFDWKPVATAVLCVDGDTGALATSHGWGDDAVYTSTYQVLLPIGKADGFVVNSKEDPIVAGEYVSGALAIAAEKITQNTDANGKVTTGFTGIEGYASSVNDAAVQVNGYDSAFLGIESNTNAFTSVDSKCGNIAASGSNLDITAIATGMPPVKGPK
jgi:hypothetical protein